MKYTGNVIKYGDNVDTDVIIPARYLNTSDHKELASHCMEDLDKTFVSRVQQGDIITAGQNFGCGSSREHAPIAIKASGVSLVIAKSFARIFYRNSINIGLAIVECPEAVDGISEGDKVEADLDSGIIRNLTTGKEYKTEPFPEFVQKIIENGGLMQSIANGIIA
ncbi:MAG: 3-isopropylmalate dehydratase small subunit [Ruminococcus flavefaciens]|nr:3-isopropylmalate dehydratase small subunit [Ruminococcus sp.]OPZ21655.1 MAG: 2,3-dimethylmalate dehydratase small subunit [Firmicutes bacterium ADurb.BinA205]HOC32465.1 3-isopropylmalate dehydratase small subunit [Ruminococcus flavefaciens]HQL99562.1 3-isopropylmalate dehydratase small subunit [Ruminococcus flavefaciens]